MIHRISTFSLLVGASAFALPLLASAQTANDSDTLVEVIVTGSRVIKDGNDMPTPVTVISVAESEAVRPATIAEQLNDMPQFSGSRGQQSGIGSGSANGGNPNGNANVLNPPNFGLTRKLILSDGPRAASPSPDGTGGVDMIPQL